MERAHHLLELGHLLTPGTAAAVSRVRSEVAEGVVAPVVDQSGLQQVQFAGEVVHRHQLDGGDPEGDQVVDDGRVGEPGEGAALVFGHPRMLHGESADVGLVDHRVGPGGVRWAIARPVEGVVHDDAARNEVRRVGVLAHGVVVETRTSHRIVEPHVAVDGAGVGVGEELRWIPSLALGGIPWPVHPESISVPVLQAAEPAVEHPEGGDRKIEAHLAPVLGEDAQFDPLGSRCPQCDIRLAGAHRHPQWIPVAWTGEHERGHVRHATDPPPAADVRLTAP